MRSGGLCVGTGCVLTKLLTNGFVGTGNVGIVSGSGRAALCVSSGKGIRVLTARFSLRNGDMSSVTASTTARRTGGCGALGMALSGRCRNVPASTRNGCATFPRYGAAIATLCNSRGIAGGTAVAFATKDKIANSGSKTACAMATLSSSAKVVAISISCGGLSIRGRFAVAGRGRNVRKLRNVRKVGKGSKVDKGSNRSKGASCFRVGCDSITGPASSDRVDRAPDTCVNACISCARTSDSSPNGCA